MPRLVSFLMVFVVFVPAVAQAEPPTKPEDVLPYLEVVYKSGDIDAYADLLTSDFKFVMEDMNTGWDKTMDIRGTTKLFEAARAELSFAGDLSVKSGAQPGTWIIENVIGTLKVTQKKDGKVFQVQNAFSFIIRDEDGEMRIAEWRQKPGK
jgi:hypothetical protein